VNQGDCCFCEGCQRSAATVLENHLYCLEHFIATSYARLEEFSTAPMPTLAGSGAGEKREGFLVECIRRIWDLCALAPEMNNLERAKLLDIVYECSAILARSENVRTWQASRGSAAERKSEPSLLPARDKVGGGDALRLKYRVQSA
jgi:hypothetical protein